MRWLLLSLILLSPIAPAEPADGINGKRAQSNYRLNCQGCHLADGAGLAGKIPSLRGIAGSFLAVPGGRQYLVQVPGSANAPLSDTELAELLNWILIGMSREQLTDDFQWYSGAEVAQYRKQVPGDVDAMRARLVENFP